MREHAQELLDLPRCTTATSGLRIEGNELEKLELIEVLDEYFSIFAAPIIDAEPNLLFDGKRCLKCNSELGGAVGSFRWGLAWGEGNCSSCGWPGRAYHIPKKDGKDVFARVLEVILQYHPCEVSIRKR